MAIASANHRAIVAFDASRPISFASSRVLTLFLSFVLEVMEAPWLWKGPLLSSSYESVRQGRHCYSELRFAEVAYSQRGSILERAQQCEQTEGEDWLNLRAPCLRFGSTCKDARARTSARGPLSASSYFRFALGQAFFSRANRRTPRSTSTGYTGLLFPETFHWSH